MDFARFACSQRTVSMMMRYPWRNTRSEGHEHTSALPAPDARRRVGGGDCCLALRDHVHAVVPGHRPTTPFPRTPRSRVKPRPSSTQTTPTEAEPTPSRERAERRRSRRRRRSPRMSLRQWSPTSAYNKFRVGVRARRPVGGRRPDHPRLDDQDHGESSRSAVETSRLHHDPGGPGRTHDDLLRGPRSRRRTGRVRGLLLLLLRRRKHDHRPSDRRERRPGDHRRDEDRRAVWRLRGRRAATCC